jgi:hypothetical protein
MTFLACLYNRAPENLVQQCAIEIHIGIKLKKIECGGDLILEFKPVLSSKPIKII